MNVTIKDIAKIANVSYSTVSKALNNSPLVKPTTKEKIMTIANELGYQPNFAAQRLVSNRTNIIGLIWPTIDRVVLSTLVTEINKKIEKTSYSMILSVEPIPQSLETFKRFQVDGIIYFDESFEKIIPEMDSPLVIYGVQDPHHNHPVIDPNHAKSMFLAVNHLKSLGHKRIAYIGDLNTEDPRQVNKFNGYLKAMKDLKLPLNEQDHIDTGGLNWNHGYDGVKKLFQFNTLPTAIISGSYDISEGILRRVKEEKMDVPNDISIVSYDNVPQMEKMEVPLTSVGVSLSYLAKNITNKIIEHIEKPDSPNAKENILLQPIITERDSCKPLNETTKTTF